jgi:hypothetical protein
MLNAAGRTGEAVKRAKVSSAREMDIKVREVGRRNDRANEVRVKFVKPWSLKDRPGKARTGR